MAIFISSCQYRKTDRRHHLVQSNYNRNDTIIISDAIVCASVDGLFRAKPLELNRDSTLGVFFNSFQKLPLIFKYRNGMMYCNRQFIAKSYIRFRKFNFEELRSLVKNQNSPVLIPIIHYNYIATRNMFITSTGGIGGDGGFNKNVHIQLGILIFLNDDLIYFSSRLYYTEPETVNRYRESIDFSIKQENIDTLVQLTMKDYIDRMK